MTISLSRKLLDRIDALAAKDNRTRSNWVVNELQRRVEQLDTKDPPSGKTTAPGLQRSGGPDVGAASGTDLPTVFLSTSANLNEDAPREIKPVIPAREKSAPTTRARAALRKMQEREGRKP